MAVLTLSLLLWAVNSSVCCLCEATEGRQLESREKHSDENGGDSEEKPDTGHNNMSSDQRRRGKPGRDTVPDTTSHGTHRAVLGSGLHPYRPTIPFEVCVTGQSLVG